MTEIKAEVASEMARLFEEGLAWLTTIERAYHIPPLADYLGRVEDWAIAANVRLQANKSHP